MKKAIILVFFVILTIPLLSQSFVDVTNSSGLNLNNIRVVAVFDYNNDDYQDLIIDYYGGVDHIYTLMKNNGDKTFTDLGEETGFPNREPLIFDYDNDGYADMAIIDTLKLRIFRNNQGVFQEVTSDLGISNPYFTAGETSTVINSNIQVHDYDKDGDLDITYISNEGGNYFLSAIVNDYTNGSFNEKTKIISSLPANGIVYTFFDMDNDLDLDVVGMRAVSQFSISSMYLWENNGGIYTNVTSGSGLVNCYPRELLTVDFNNDGYLDIIKGGADAGGGSDYRVFINNGDKTFTDASSSYLIRVGNHYYSAPAFIDFDNDFDNDIHWTSMASLTDGRLRLFQNDGNLNFAEVSTGYGIHLGSTIGGVPIAGGTPSVFFDYDNDGDLDVFISERRYFSPYGGVGYMMENQLGGNYLKVKVNGCSTNKDGKDVKVIAAIGSDQIMLYNSHGVNAIGPDKSNIFHFGLGGNSQVDQLRVIWQNGGETTLENIAANQVIEINEDDNCPSSSQCLVYDTITTIVYDTVRLYNNEIQYIKFESYYSADNGQVNVYEIQAYKNGANIALSKPGYANSYEWGDYSTNGINVVDGSDFSRWSSNRNDLGPDTLNPHMIIIDLEEKVTIDSLILNIRGFDSWNQTFNFFVSSDSVDWYLVGKGVDTTGIFTYTKTMPFIVYDTIYATVYDTIYSTVYDTITTEVFDTTYVSVSDTLIIDVLLEGVNSPESINTLKVYPNPAKDFIFINTGDYTQMNGYHLKIINQLGTLVFETNVVEPLYEINLSNWTGYGLYYIQLIDSGGNILDIRKIILQ